MPKSSKVQAAQDNAEALDEMEHADDAEENYQYSGFMDPEATYTLTNPDWPAGSFWTFRQEMTDEDDEAISDMTTKWIVKGVTNAMIADWVKHGLNVREQMGQYLEQEAKMSTRRATLVHMSVEWGGPLFTIRKGFQSRNPETGTLELDEYAGQAPPCTEKYLKLLGPKITNAAFWQMNPFWVGGRSPEKEETFPTSDSGTHEPGLDGEGSPEVQTPPAA